MNVRTCLSILLETSLTMPPEQYEAGAQMVLDAILLSLEELVSILSPDHDLAIIPEMKLEDALLTKDGF